MGANGLIWNADSFVLILVRGTDVFDFLAIDLVDGKLRISISQGEEKVFQKILSKSDSLNDGVFHLVEFRKRGKVINFQNQKLSVRVVIKVENILVPKDSVGDVSCEMSWEY